MINQLKSVLLNIEVRQWIESETQESEWGTEHRFIHMNLLRPGAFSVLVSPSSLVLVGADRYQSIKG